MGVDDGGGVRQAGGGEVVVGDDDVDADGARVGHGLDVSHAAIDGDEERGAAPPEHVDRAVVEAVSLVHPVRDVVQDVQPAPAERLHEQRRSGYAVGVEVAVHGDGLSGAAGFFQPPNSVVDVGQGRRVFEQRLRHVEELPRLIRLAEAPAPQEMAHGVGQGSQGGSVNGLGYPPGAPLAGKG